MPRSITLAAAVLASSCTFNVSTFEREVRAESGAVVFTRVRADLAAIEESIDGGEVIVRGVDRSDAAVVVRVAGVLGVGGDADAIADDVRVEWIDAGGGALELRVAYDGPRRDTASIERIELELPPETELELTTNYVNVDVVGLRGAMTLTAATGSIRVRGAGEVRVDAGAGSVDVEASRGELTSDLGSIRLAMTGDVQAYAGSGSVVGTFGGGGSISTDSGSIDVELTTPLDRDLTLETNRNALILRVPPGIGFELDTTPDRGSVTVEAGGVSHSGDEWDGPVGGGGEHTIRARSISGSIQILESGGA